MRSVSERTFFALAALLFTALVLINYGPVFMGKIPIPGHMVTQFPAWAEFTSRDPWQAVADIGDLVTYFYPFNAFSSQQIQQGTIPLWNPYILAGMPFQAEPQSALFYPLHVLYYVFSTPTAWALALILRMILAALFMTLLMRAIGATRTGAIVSGTVFAFGAFMVVWQGAVMGDSVIWLPLICYSVHRLYAKRSRGSVALTAFAFAMPVLAGHPETAIHVTLTGLAAFLLLWIFPSRPASRFDSRFLVFVAAAGILSLGLSAVQLLPTVEWVRHSGRDVNAPWDGRFVLHQVLGFFSRDALRGPNSAGVIVPNAMGYAGMFTLLAAALAPLHRSSRYVIWFFLLVVIGIAGTFGFEPLRWILNHTPVMMGLKNERLIMLVDFGLAALAGLGVSALQEERPEGSLARRLLPWLLVAVAFTLAMIGVHQLQHATQFKVEVMRRPSFSRTLLLSGLILTVWKLIRMQQAKLFPFVACALVIFDLGTFAYGYSAFTWRDELFPQAPVLDFLNERGKTDTFRVVPILASFNDNTGMPYDVQSLTGFEAAVPPSLNRFVSDFATVYADSISPIAEKIVSTPDRRLDMLNVKYVVVPSSGAEYEMFAGRPDRFSSVFKREAVAIFENKRALPRAFLVGTGGVQLVQGLGEQIAALKQAGFDPLQSVVLYSLPKELVDAHSESEFNGRVEIVESDVDSYRFRVQASAAGILIVSQNYYAGWKAMVDGRSASVFPADHALTGIAVPAGNYEVSFEFKPSSFRIGVLLTLISLALLVVLLVPTRRGAISHRKVNVAEIE